MDIFCFGVNLTTDDIINTHARTRTESKHAAYKLTEYMKKKTLSFACSATVTPSGGLGLAALCVMCDHLHC